MKRFFGSLVLIGTLLFIMTGCTSSKSFTFDVTTGDKIKIELDTSNGHNLSSSMPFTISKDDNTLSQGTFITMDGYNQYLDIIENDSSAKVIDNGSKKGVTYTFYSVNDAEFNYVIKIDNSKTAVLLANANSESEAKSVFDLLTFSVE